MANRVASKVCNIEDIIVPLLKCNDPSSPLPKIFGLKPNQEHGRFIDMVQQALGALGTFNSDAAAGTGGVAVGGWYVTGAAHAEGLSAGVLKQRLS